MSNDKHDDQFEVDLRLRILSYTFHVQEQNVT